MTALENTSSKIEKPASHAGESHLGGAYAEVEAAQRSQSKQTRQPSESTQPSSTSPNHIEFTDPYAKSGGSGQLASDRKADQQSASASSSKDAEGKKQPDGDAYTASPVNPSMPGDIASAYDKRAPFLSSRNTADQLTNVSDDKKNHSAQKPDSQPKADTRDAGGSFNPKLDGAPEGEHSGIYAHKYVDIPKIYQTK
jgi:hypothetical protein